MIVFKRRSKKQVSAAKAPFIYPVIDAPCPVSDDWKGFEYCFRYDETKGSPGEAKAYINSKGRSAYDYCKEHIPDNISVFDHDFDTRSHLVSMLGYYSSLSGSKLRYPYSIQDGFIFKADPTDEVNFSNFVEWNRGNTHQCVILDNPDAAEFENTRFIKSKDELPEWPVISVEEPFYGDLYGQSVKINRRLQAEIPFSERRFKVTTERTMTGAQLERLIEPKDLKKLEKSERRNTLKAKTNNGKKFFCVREYSKKKSSGPKRKMSEEEAAKRLTGLKQQIQAEDETISYLTIAIRTGRISPAILCAIQTDGDVSLTEALKTHIADREKMIKRYDALRKKYPNVKLGFI